MVLAADGDYPFLGVVWTMLVFFGLVVWFWLLITVFADVFRRRDLSGWAKTGWVIVVIVLPLLGVFVYLITQGKNMAERKATEQQAVQAQVDEHIKSVAGGPATEIDKARELLNTGAITQSEYEAIKHKALA